MSEGFVNGKFTLNSELFVTSSGENNDVELNSSLKYVSVSNDLDSITGFDAGSLIDGYLILVVNVGPTNNLILKNNDSSSVVTNRILTADGLDYVVPPFNTAILGYDTTGQMWHVLRVPDVTLSSYQASPSNPSGTTSSTGVMMGLAGTITPSKSGRVMIIISGNIANNVAGDGAQAQIRYGTGTAPSNGDALTGTAVGNGSRIVNPLLALLVPGNGNFNCNAIVSGLTLGVPYWIDLGVNRLTGGTATVSNISISVVEL